MMEFFERAIVADLKIEGYKFMCAGRFQNLKKCPSCNTELVDFITLDVTEAYEHGLKNVVPMWIVKGDNS